MVSREQYDLVVELVDDAVAGGATLHCGGPTRVEGLASETFYAPAVLTGVTPEMRIMREEIFGPVVPIVTVDSEEEAIRLANDSPFGLGASVWTGDRAEGPADRAPDPGGDGLDQRPHVLARRDADAVGRGQGLGPRALARPRRIRRVREPEARRVRARPDEGLLVVSVRRVAERRHAELRPSCSTAATPTRWRRSGGAPPHSPECCARRSSASPRPARAGRPAPRPQPPGRPTRAFPRRGGRAPSPRSPSHRRASTDAAARGG